MKLKIAFFALLCAATVLLTGCGGDVVYKNGIADIKNANITISFPEDWTVVVGGDVYSELLNTLDYESVSADTMKAIYESGGARLLLVSRSPDENVFAMFTQGHNEGGKSAEDIVRAMRDDSVASFDSYDYFTVAESSLGEYTWGGVTGAMSVVRLAVKEDGSVFTEQRNFCFERDDTVFWLQIHISGGFEREADGIEIAAVE